MAWYHKTEIVRQLPRRYQMWAYYARLMSKRSSGRVVGGSFLLRALGRLGRWCGAGTGRSVRANDLRMFIDLADPDSMRALNSLSHPPLECRVLEPFLNQGDTFVDVGANYGAFSLLMSRRVGDRGRIVAVEPQPRLAELIRRSFAANELSNSQMLEQACGDRVGEMDLYVPPWSSGRASLHRGYVNRTRACRVPINRLDDSVNWHNWTGRVVIKVDVEGNEFAVLCGAQRLIRRHQPVILFEINPSAITAAGGTTDELIQLVSSLGYRRFSTALAYPDIGGPSIVPRNKNCDVLALE